MFTFHPIARLSTKTGEFIPTIMVRNTSGRMVGSKASATTFTDAKAAEAFARDAAWRAARRDRWNRSVARAR